MKKSFVPFQKFQLCTEDRHLIYAGDMFRWEGTTWKKVRILLKFI